MTQLTIHRFHEAKIEQRAADGYLNATAMCKAAGKRFNHYASNDTTNAFLAALSADAGIPASEMIQQVKGGRPELQGTWVHPKVAIHLAQWLSPEFAVQVTNWVFDWLNGKTVAVRDHTRKPPEKRTAPALLGNFRFTQEREGAMWRVEALVSCESMLRLVKLCSAS